MKSIKGGANANGANANPIRKSRKSVRRKSASNAKKPKSKILKRPLRRTKSLNHLKRGKRSKKVNYGPAMKRTYGSLNGPEYSEWAQNQPHLPLDNCVPVNDNNISLPTMYNKFTKAGKPAIFTDKIGTVYTCPTHHPYLGKSGDDRWCCFKNHRDAIKNDHLASRVKAKLKKQASNIHSEFARSLPEGINAGPEQWKRSFKRDSAKEMHNNLTGKHLDCKPEDSGRERNIVRCSSDMYPCYDAANGLCYDVDGDLSVNPNPNISRMGNNLRPKLKGMRQKGVKSQVKPYF